MGQCKDCKYWERLKPWRESDPPPILGQCKLVDTENAPIFVDCDHADVDVSPSICTKETFGCIAFEPQTRKDVLTELAAYDQELDI